MRVAFYFHFPMGWEITFAQARHVPTLYPLRPRQPADTTGEITNNVAGEITSNVSTPQSLCPHQPADATGEITSNQRTTAETQTIDTQALNLLADTSMQKEKTNVSDKVINDSRGKFQQNLPCISAIVVPFIDVLRGWLLRKFQSEINHWKHLHELIPRKRCCFSGCKCNSLTEGVKLNRIPMIPPALPENASIQRQLTRHKKVFLRKQILRRCGLPTNDPVIDRRMCNKHEYEDVVCIHP